ncbi:MAG: hypothetical protein ACI92N_002971 [Pseudomonadales bacterium]|jgi:hypothetical protein
MADLGLERYEVNLRDAVKDGAVNWGGIKARL